MAELTRLVCQRKILRGLITTQYNKVNNNTTLPPELRTISFTIEESHTTLKELNEKIQALKFNDQSTEDEYEQEYSLCQEYNTKCCYLKGITTESQSTNNTTTTNNTTHNNTDSARSVLKSPTTPLPFFNSEEEEDLNSFFAELDVILEQHCYSDRDKLIILKQQLSGRALEMLESLEPDQQMYNIAKTFLISSLASPEIQKTQLIRKLTEIQLPNGADPFVYMSKIRKTVHKFNSQQVTVDDMMLYFFWLGMNEDMKELFRNYTKTNSPTLTELLENMTVVCQRYLLQQKHPMQNMNNTNNITSLAANTSQWKCILCIKNMKNADHPLYKCELFPTAETKIPQLKKFNLCTKCGNEHCTYECKFIFKQPCRKCKKFHFAYLCINQNTPKQNVSQFPMNKNKTNKFQKDKKYYKTQNLNTNSNLITITESALQAQVHTHTFLPTFTAYSRDTQLRILKDQGCQSNLISAPVAKKLKLRVVDEVNLTIQGINENKTYNTQLVEVPLKIDNQEHIIEALCIPSISISLQLPLLPKIVQQILNKGYTLADEHLLQLESKIENLDLIIGTRSCFIIPEQDIMFGESSLYSQTPTGILLKGDSEQMLKDLKDLPPHDHTLTPTHTTHPLPVQVQQHTQLDSIKQLDEMIDEWGREERIICRTGYEVLNEKGEINENNLENATREMLEKECEKMLSLDTYNYKEDSTETNDNIMQFAIHNLQRNEEGRLIMPLFWDSQNSHLLGKNKNLAQAILHGNLKKLRKNPTHLKLMEETIREQEREGIIERIENIDGFLEEHPEASFLPHMGVFKLDRETTKCRVVFLSNLCEKQPDKMTVSHNQAILPGPNMNFRLASALLQLRFDKFLLAFDLKKAFNSIGLNEIDQNRLLFLWFKNPSKGDFSLIAYRNVRLCFGLRCAPTLLMLALYHILVLEAEDDEPKLKNFKNLIYQLSYMDNAAITYNTEEELKWGYNQLSNIFEPYCFGLQQFLTNSSELQEIISDPTSESDHTSVKLLGLQWDTQRDTLYTRPISLNPTANTKRKILSSIAGQFDLFSFNAPILNRGRLFLHSLQCDKQLEWDQVLPQDKVREWKNIVNQANSSPKLEIERFVGSREDSYRLITFSDSSKDIYGAVSFIQSTSTQKVSFICAKNRLINTQLHNKSIPTLELQGVTLATELTLDLYQEMGSDHCINPIHIESLHIFSDSMVVLAWLDSYLNKKEKLQKRSVFVQNRLSKISKLCEKKQITFSFIGSSDNPADCITRCISPKQLLKSNYFTGPDVLKLDEANSPLGLRVTIPDPRLNSHPPPRNRTVENKLSIRSQ